ncbi:MAG: hypothetical protein AVDCRST_MAG91-2108, partial [uncultured Sphingomonadaceae bacterium]
AGGAVHQRARDAVRRGVGAERLFRDRRGLHPDLERARRRALRPPVANGDAAARARHRHGGIRRRKRAQM